MSKSRYVHREISSFGEGLALDDQGMAIDIDGLYRSNLPS